jgi:hypothetical protein
MVPVVSALNGDTGIDNTGIQYRYPVPVPIPVRSILQFWSEMQLTWHIYTLPVMANSLKNKKPGIKILIVVETSLKETVSRDFRPSVFFVKLYPWVP